MHRVVLLCLVLLTLISCSASTEIDPDLLYPLKSVYLRMTRMRRKARFAIFSRGRR